MSVNALKQAAEILNRDNKANKKQIKTLERELAERTERYQRQIEELSQKLRDADKKITALLRPNGTPANNHAEGEDPFANYLDRERSDLPLGEYNDDALANAIFMNYDVFPSVEDLVSGKGKMPIVYMTAGKERIRWLSRQVLRLIEEVKTLKGAPHA